MRTARALVASIGTSVLLIAAATLSLLSASFVFAIGGFEGAGDTNPRQALVLDVVPHARAGSHARQAGRVVSPPPAVLDSPTPAQSRATRPPRVHSRAPATTARPSSGSTQVAALGTGTASPPQPVADTPPPAHAPAPKNLGDGVRELGDNVSTTLKKTGDDLAAVTAPLGQPVSTAVQQVINLLSALLQGATNGLGGALGAQP